MAGLTKAKKYDWKDSNLALFGTPLEREIKKKSAETEKAWHVVNKTDEEAIFIWRIVKFVPTPWPKEDYGKFFDGDSYIVLNKFKPPGEDGFEYDVHFWIGADSTQDEYGTAAYKTVELDTFLDDKPIQHREVQGHESDLFQSYFGTIELLKGGADSGFRHVTTEKYEPRLLQIVGGRNNVLVKEVPFCQKSLNSDDCFILDFGKKLYQMIGKNANKDEKFKAITCASKMRSERHGAEIEVVDEEGATEEEVKQFLSMLPVTCPEADANDDDTDSGITKDVKRLFKLSDASGKLEFSEVAQGDIKKSMLDSADVFIVDTGDHLYVWTGKGASTSERKNSLSYGHNYLLQHKNPLRPITSVMDGREGEDFFKHAITVA
ncbi:gelsolin-like protein 2 [Tubulanus polymorphus]|uniref:gelsolin-like protein 2 n=1 Tax=Tubulanus polymorphus TaxID=672921 RepID=UPI003DA1FBBF